jgi:hypothetical protein
MTSKVKHNQKDINIVVEIENNLMSKNKTQQSHDKEEKQNARPRINTIEHTYNPELPRMINEYFGVMASKQPYSISGRHQPLNINNYLSNPNHVPIHVPSDDEEEEDEIEDEAEGEDDDEEDLSQFETIEVQGRQVPVFDKAQETEYANKLRQENNDKFKKRNKIIDKLKTGYYKPRIQTLKSNQLFFYVRKHRTDLYTKILNGTY